MEKLEKKHNHRPTKILKFLIFMFVMFAPFFSILSKCLYTLNPNVAQSYYGETINEKEIVQINTLNQLVANKTYVFTISNTSVNTNNSITNMIYCTNVKNVIGTTGLQNTFSFTTYQYQTGKHLYIKFEDNTSLDITITTDISFEFDYLYNTIENQTAYESHFNQTIKKYEYNKYSYIDNVFEYAVRQLNDDNLYNWSKNTGIYTAIEGMVSGLGANETLSMLLAYWGILTAIYIVFDIVIESFTKLTHMFSE